jgi:alpha-L-rhamnosidase
MTNPPRTAGEVLETLRLAGRDSDLLTRLTDPKTPGWANLLARGATFTWEVWDPSDLIGDSMSHGWGANVLVEIQRGLLGLEPTGPGYATFRVAPPAGGLPTASGRVPTPRGVIAVRWQRGSGTGAWTLDLTVPANATATVRLPGLNAAHVTEGGHPLRAVTGARLVGTDHGTAIFEVGAGTYHVRAS